MSRELISFDYAMKNLLRDKANYCILEGFLIALLNEEITICSIEESESNSATDMDKYNRVDILALDSKNRHLIIEVQYNKETDYLERAIWGASKAVVDSLSKGDAYKKIKKVISISLIYFTLLDAEEYLIHGQMSLRGLRKNKVIKVPMYAQDEKTQQMVISYPDRFQEYYFVNMRAFDNNVCKPIDEWIYMFKNNNIKDSFSSKHIKLAGERLKVLNLPNDERRVYDEYVKSQTIQRDVMNTARKEGREEGFAEGEAKGLAKGLAKGKREIAINFLDILSNELIAEKVGLTIEQVEQLRQEHRISLKG